MQSVCPTLSADPHHRCACGIRRNRTSIMNITATSTLEVNGTISAEHGIKKKKQFLSKIKFA
jgi:hypothetical protein